MRKLLTLGVSAAVALAGLLVAGAPQTAQPAQAALLPAADWERQIATLINEDRAAAGFTPLSVSVAISTVARNWSQSRANITSTVSAINPNFGSQIPQSGLVDGAELVVVGYADTAKTFYTPQDVINTWLGSSSSKSALRSSDFTHLGVGVVVKTAACSASSSRTCNFLWVTADLGEYLGEGPTDLFWWSPFRPVTPFVRLTLTPDMTGDGKGEVLAIDLNGALALYPFRTNKLGPNFKVGKGFGAMSIYGPGDWNRDGQADLFGVTTDGRLFRYNGKGGGQIAAGVQIGKGWSSYRIIPAGDVTGDTYPDLLAIDSSGYLWTYPGTGPKGNFQSTRIMSGKGWIGIDCYGAGDLNADGKADILAITSTGKLLAYLGKGGGKFGGATEVGHGWNTGIQLVAGADLNGDKKGDIVGLTPDRRLLFYSGRGGGSFNTPIQIGAGW
ncbi:MAG: FG-GAP-like repeat-containing protein [Bifidobacteriaceae bacterium]|jgi:hypothetical protein|nr:FG-GAP-like repeat-containing protein [Bifidobacteriaceae bacterium]